MISYQGVLTDSSGTPLDGQYQMRFKIYNHATTGDPLWTEEWYSPKVTVTGGLFNVLLGSSQPIDLSAEEQPFDAQYWLGVEVYKDGSGYEILTPRHKLASAAYALRAATVEEGAIGDSNIVSLSATKLTSTAGKIDNTCINWAAPGDIGTTTAGTGYFTNLFASGNVGIGTTEPLSRLHIMGSSDGSNYGEMRLSDGYGGGISDRKLIFRSPRTGEGLARIFLEGTSSSLRLGTRDYPDLVELNNNGKVGIGTTNPLEKLHLVGSDEPLLFHMGGCQAIASNAYYQSTGGWKYATDGTAFRIYFANDDCMQLDYAPVGSAGASVPFSAGISLKSNGNVGIGKTDPNYKLDVVGTIRGEGYSCPNADLAEKLAVHPDYELPDEELKAKVSKLNLSDTEKKAMIERKEISKLEPGTVVVISKDGVVPCAKENDARLAGIISTSPAVKMASEEKGQYIALAGKVPCKIIGKIKAGDMLTTSTVEGHAQKAEQPVLGAVVGKALEDFDGERGVIDVWVGGM
jgi:hypothetical protein